MNSSLFLNTLCFDFPFSIRLIFLIFYSISVDVPSLAGVPSSPGRKSIRLQPGAPEGRLCRPRSVCDGSLGRGSILILLVLADCAEMMVVPILDVPSPFPDFLPCDRLTD